ncbi:hypothetical protein TNCT_306051 [Trichonephila clavata]|uniref:Uncharacterized protein n=1 Tax=Trichonephila clavata TaxID=2740835 RepID=A0A8X6FKN6_TRICU|nr:hypothetical protein TNCT_306051 [Trichonephila clavata]
MSQNSAYSRTMRSLGKKRTSSNGKPAIGHSCKMCTVQGNEEPPKSSGCERAIVSSVVSVKLWNRLLEPQRPE